DRPCTQTLVESEPARWFARSKVDQVMLQVLAPDRSHPSLPTDGRGPPNLYLAPVLLHNSNVTYHPAFYFYDRHPPSPYYLDCLSACCNGHLVSIAFG